MIKRLFQSLGFRLLAPLFLAVGGVLACYAFISFHSTEDHFLHLVRGDVERTSGMIKRATHDAMLINRKMCIRDRAFASKSGRAYNARTTSETGSLKLSVR